MPENIKFITKHNEVLDIELASKLEVLVNKSFRDENNVCKTYTEEQQNLFLMAYSVENVVRWQPRFSVFAFDGDKLVGSGFFGYRKKPNSDETTPFLWGMYIDPEYRGGGIGTKILNMRLEHAKSLGEKEVYSDALDFPPTLEFLKRRGYVKIGEISTPPYNNITIKFHEMKRDLREL